MAMTLAISMLMAACGGGSEGASGDSGEGGSGESKELSLLTGGTGGTYYPLGGEIANLWGNEANVSVTAQTSGASAENMQTLKDGDAEIAFSQTDIATYAVEGKEMFEGKAVDNVSAVASLYPETIQIVTTKNSGIKSVEDLKGKAVSIGAPGSGVNINATQILEIHGMSVNDIKHQNLSFDESTDGIQSGSIDAAFVTAGAPTAAVDSLSVQEEVVIVPLADDKMKELQEAYPYYANDKVPAGTYKIEEDVNTVAVNAMLVASNDLDEETVYNMTKALFEKTDSISNAKGDFIKAETALDGIGDLPLHPGAKKYFDEKGIK
ncbi:TAXI family TRAP transporter solute-binding subunit [Bacillus sp. IB182487]|uniref:TAXI family TRAP transporter solute-binding subunit n=2 Tax=Metabacillus arenae TaxID=2771434 RepID=A0A926NCJ9_9BACI|nr:TAXI family TRAP transporter solute-binding subunit [Metabacillus arenae]